MAITNTIMYQHNLIGRTTIGHYQHHNVPRHNITGLMAPKHPKKGANQIIVST